MDETKKLLEELIKPTPAKVLVSFIVGVYLLSIEFTDKIWCYQGLPLPIYRWCGPENIPRDHALSLGHFIVADLVVWYLLGCLLSWFLFLLFGRYLNIN
ncbi:MAG: hypothetical protein B6U97_00100 [Candidatus Altiarchaeales archaeon ex4484_96]|nr:MAG: hypothetical protein B6U97_00100 [Candidatus Altiarchaeales archaeon ex4484_96]